MQVYMTLPFPRTNESGGENKKTGIRDPHGAANYVGILEALSGPVGSIAGKAMLGT